MRFDPERHHRRSIRLKGYDYSQPGAYFITICTQDRACLFGEVVDGEIRLNEYGHIAWRCWAEIPLHFPHAELDAFVVMPNHVHGIVILTVGARHDVVGARHAVPLQNGVFGKMEQFGKPVPGSIPTIVRSFKSASTRHINALRGTPGAPVWQRNYYEHIVRNEESLNRIREYIVTNPMRWALDHENPYREGIDTFDEWMNRFVRRGHEDAR
jgi:REP element-mobilizing transposase RayT